MRACTQKITSHGLEFRVRVTVQQMNTWVPVIATPKTEYGI